MRKSFGLIFLPLFVAAAEQPAEITSLPAVSSFTAIVSTPSVALVGETKDLPPPHGMTDAPAGSLFTLTRSSLDRSQWPAQVDVISSDELNRFGARNAGEAIQRALGVDILALGETNASLLTGLRGGLDRQILILLDGRPLAGASLTPSDLSEVPLEQIDRIEIVRGGLSALYGPGATSGVINILSKRSVHQGFPLSHYTYEARSYSAHTNRLDFGSRMGRFDYFFNANSQRLSGFRDDSENHQSNLSANVGVDLSAFGRVQLDGGRFARRARWSGTDPLNLDPSAFNNKDEKLGTRINAWQTNETIYGRSSWLVPLPANQSLALRSALTERSLEHEDPLNRSTSLRVVDESRSRNTLLDAQWDGPRGVSAGAGFAHDRLDYENRLVSASSFIRTAENWNLWAQESVSIQPLTLIATARWDHHSQFGKFVSPRALVVADLNSLVRWSASASRSWSVPRLEDLWLQSTLQTANPDLKPEKLWTYETGVEIHQDSATLKAAVFHVRGSDMLQLDPRTLGRVDNVTDLRRNGLEVEGRQVVNARFHHSLRYQFLEQRARPLGSVDRVALAYTPRHRVDWDVTLFPSRRFSRFRVDSIVRWRDASTTGNNHQGRSLAPRATWDLRLSWYWRQAELFAGANNLTGRRLEDVEGFPLPGRTCYGGVRVRLWG